jgi:hypothetical protein
MKENFQIPHNPHNGINNDAQNFIVDKEKSRKEIIKERISFIPFISLKVVISFIICEFYLSYAAYNPIDTPYIKKSICLIVFMFFYTYYLSVMTRPIQTNVDKYFNYPIREVQCFNPYYWQDCPFCKSKKFIRSSHCRTCQQCILYRDHHCPYTANCIGFNNIQYFLNFLFWGMYEIVYYNISIIKFSLKPNNTKLNDGSNIPKYFKLWIFIDFLVNVLFFNGILYLFFRTILIIYENYTTYNKERNPGIKRNFFCYNVYKKSNTFKIDNEWNLGFLKHFYYGIGPTILHAIFPLPKFKNYCIDENCGFFRKQKNAEKNQLLKYTLKEKKTDFESLMNSLDSNPDDFIKKAHEYYDGKEII